MVKRFKRDLNHDVMCYNCIFLQNLHNNNWYRDCTTSQTQAQGARTTCRRSASPNRDLRIASPTPCHWTLRVIYRMGKSSLFNKQAVRLGGRHNMPPPRDLDFWPFDLESVWESHVTWGTLVQSFVFLGLLVFELEPMYATSDRRTDRRTTDADHRLMPPYAAGA